MDINRIILQFVILGPPFLFAITFHELAHGYVAFRLGDPTAKNAGRLTMNPLKHLDPLGVLAFIIIKIGWAKPVPVDARYFKDQRRDMMIVSLAGPGANVVLAVASALLYKLFLLLTAVPVIIADPVELMLRASVWINIMLAIFNLLPVPPLDGSQILSSLLPPDAARSYEQLAPYGFIVILVLAFTGILKHIIPVIDFFYSLLV